MSVGFLYANRKLSITGKRGIREFVSFLFTNEEKRAGILTYVFCSDEFLLDINKKFLGHDFYTDIITFDLSEPNSDLISGECYVSIDRVKENALEAGIDFIDELLRVLFHGALHLCGYGDKTKSQILEMRTREDYYLRLYAKMKERST